VPFFARVKHEQQQAQIVPPPAAERLQGASMTRTNALHCRYAKHAQAWETGTRRSRRLARGKPTVGNQIAETDRGRLRMPKRGIKQLTPKRLRELARTGAETTLNNLRAEIIALERAFPELALPRRRQAVRRAVKEARRRTRQMSVAARRAVSERMKRYWAERRKARAKVK
jgi:hypothetical protein